MLLKSDQKTGEEKIAVFILYAAAMRIARTGQLLCVVLIDTADDILFRRLETDRFAVELPVWVDLSQQVFERSGGDVDQVGLL
ncbi:hypothetical protein Enr10x_50250 [Gimesia panareensis]|uniref:Uncharacterized protein n=1 Tax=Gimesia panareensis TaxID=2527978 RepID=A0A518ADA8_9PLAN|nr:hypothetical protein Enr10x_50250 [Gimesia panareensis]QDU52711.1 hypothetical protein Pan110_50910 [Gimesia panareensis]